MTSLKEKLQQRRVVAEATEKVYESFGKRRQAFKEGKGRVYKTETCSNLVAVLKTAYDPAPVESCPVEFPADAIVTPEQQATITEPPGPPPAPHEVRSRAHWAAHSIKFRHTRTSRAVIEEAKKLMQKYHLNNQVVLRLALLCDYEDLDSGKEMLDTYLKAMERMKLGVSCLKVNRNSLKIVKKVVMFDSRNALLRIKPVSKVFSWRALEVDVRAIEDVYPGTLQSSEFCELNKRMKTVGARLQEDCCCVVKTVFRTYSLIFSARHGVDDLCAVMDLFKGLHGPAVWRQDAAHADAVFRLEGDLEPQYDLQH